MSSGYPNNLRSYSKHNLSMRRSEHNFKENNSIHNM